MEAWNYPCSKSDVLVAGMPCFAIILYHGDKATCYKEFLRYDTVNRLADSVWKNNQPIDSIRVVNQKTGMVCHVLPAAVSCE